MIPYILQHPDFALGNFINLTPAIRWLAERLPEEDEGKVPVYFSTDYVRECFLDCDFIHHLDSMPDYDPAFSSCLINQSNDRPDFQHAFNVLTGQNWQLKYHTYVDSPMPNQIGHVLIINGSGSDDPKYIYQKYVGPEPYEYVCKIGRRRKIIACGSYSDMDRSPYMARLAHEGVWGNMRHTLSLIAGARCIIANDTGLAHAAGAMNKPLLVLWKNTPRERCKNAGTLTEYSYENHEENIQRFLEKYL